MAADAGYCRGSEKAQQCRGTQKEGCPPQSGADSPCGTTTVTSHFASELSEFWGQLALPLSEQKAGRDQCMFREMQPLLSL